MAKLNKQDLLNKLEPIVYEPGDQSQDAQLEKMRLSGALLRLAEITHEREYVLCRKLAEHLLGSLPTEDDE